MNELMEAAATVRAGLATCFNTNIMDRTVFAMQVMRMVNAAEAVTAPTMMATAEQFAVAA